MKNYSAGLAKAKVRAALVIERAVLHADFNFAAGVGDFAMAAMCAEAFDKHEEHWGIL